MFAGVVWLAYTQGVAKGRSDAPRMIVAETGPVKTAPANPGGTQTPYTGLKIYQAQAPADDSGDSDSVPPAPTPAGSAASAPAISPSLAPVIRPAAAAATTNKSAPPADVTPKPAATKLAQVAAPTPAAMSNETPAASAAPLPTENRVATKPPAKLSPVVQSPPKPIVVPAPKAPPAETAATPTAAPAETLKPTASGSYLLQIGAYKSEEEATAAWKSYQAKHPVVGGYESDIKKVDLGDKGVWYRLRVGSFDDKTAAAALCDKLKADGGNCFLAK